MNQKLFENAHKNTTIYDGVHEYCTVEHVNEAFFRASIRKRRNRGTQSLENIGHAGKR